MAKFRVYMCHSHTFNPIIERHLTHRVPRNHPAVSLSRAKLRQKLMPQLTDHISRIPTACLG